MVDVTQDKIFIMSVMDREKYYKANVLFTFPQKKIVSYTITDKCVTIAELNWFLGSLKCNKKRRIREKGDENA